ncbi:MAG: hypothetical protein ACMG6S_08340 [Byssovorax sp.]
MRSAIPAPSTIASTRASTALSSSQKCRSAAMASRFSSSASARTARRLFETAALRCSVQAASASARTPRRASSDCPTSFERHARRHARVRHALRRHPAPAAGRSLRIATWDAVARAARAHAPTGLDHEK